MINFDECKKYIEDITQTIWKSSNEVGNAMKSLFVNISN